MKSIVDKRHPAMLLAVLTVSLLILAIFSFRSVGEIPAESESGQAVQVIQVPVAADNLLRETFWKEKGHLIFSEKWEITTEHLPVANYIVEWEMEHRNVWLVPTGPESDHIQSATEFVRQLTKDGYVAWLELANKFEKTEHGDLITIKVGQALPELGVEVMTHEFHLRLVSPTSAYHSLPDQMGGSDRLMDNASDDGEVGSQVQPKLAIVIDDWGYKSSAVDVMAAFPYPLTMAVLPYLPISQEVAEMVSRHGHEVILHQPMEPLNSYFDIGQGGIFANMSKDEIRERLLENLQHLPIISGINNHMGSMATSDHKTMQVILEMLRELDLFFLDSRTTPLTVTKEVAEKIGTAYVINDFFIDNVNDVAAIKEQIRRALSLAKQRGQITVIGHVRPQTATALWEMIPEIVESGVQLVPVSQLLNYPEPAIHGYRQVQEEGVY